MTFEQQLRRRLLRHLANCPAASFEAVTLQNFMQLAGFRDVSLDQVEAELRYLADVGFVTFENSVLGGRVAQITAVGRQHEEASA
jgi:hypothetical protein